MDIYGIYIVVYNKEKLPIQNNKQPASCTYAVVRETIQTEAERHFKN